MTSLSPIRHITFDRGDPFALASFWSAVTGWPLDDGSERNDEEVERLTALGGRVLANHRTPEGRGWIVMADPEGNEFCIETSTAERATLTASN